MTNNKRLIHKRWFWFLLIFPLFMTGGFTLLYQAAPYMIITPRKYSIGRTPADYQLPFEKIAIPTRDGITLQAYWIHRPADTGKTTVLMLHGVGACKERWLSTAAWLWENGYETILLDSRAHGESGGEYCTYGYFEKYDVADVLDYVLKQKQGGKLGVWGNSMGGAVAIQALAIEPRLQFGIVQSTFADFRTIVFDYQQRRLKIPWQWFSDSAISEAEETAHFAADSIRPAEAARHIRQPMLMAHGDADDRIKIAYGREIFDNLASEKKEWHTIEGAHHLNVWARGGVAYRNDLLRFLESQSRRQ